MSENSRGTILLRRLYRSVLGHMRWKQAVTEGTIRRRPLLGAGCQIETLEQRLMLSSAPVIEIITAVHEDFRFIAGVDIPSVQNTYEAEVSGTVNSVTFSVGGLTSTDKVREDGWSAEFDMSSATTTDPLHVTANGPGGSDSDTHPVDILLLPEWFHQDDVKFATSFDWATGYSFDMTLSHFYKGFSTPADWVLYVPGTDFKLFDMANKHTGFAIESVFQVTSDPDGHVDGSDYQLGIKAEVFDDTKEMDNPFFEYFVDFWGSDTVPYEQSFGFGTVSGSISYGASIQPHFSDDLTFDGISGRAWVDPEIQVTIPLVPMDAARIPILGIPGLLDFVFGADISFGLDTLDHPDYPEIQHMLSFSPNITTEGGLGLDSVVVAPGLTGEVTGYGEAELLFGVGSVGLRVGGKVQQGLVAEYDGDWTYSAPGSLTVSGDVYYETLWGFGKSDNFDLFEWTVGTWDFLSGGDPLDSSDTPKYGSDVLTNPRISLTEGEPGSLTFSVDYCNPGKPPAKAYVVMSDESEEAMTRISGSDDEGTYEVTIAGAAEGSNYFSFVFIDTSGAYHHLLSPTLGSLADPQVMGTNPADGASSVQPNTNIAILFDRDVDESTVESNVSVSGSTSGTHTFTFSSDTAAHRLIIDPEDDWDPGETVQVTISTDLKFMDGQSLDSGHTFGFITKEGTSSGSHAAWSMSWFIQDALSDAHNRAVDWRESLEAQPDIRSVSLHAVGQPSVGELLVSYESGVAGDETIYGELYVTQGYDVTYEKQFVYWDTTESGSDPIEYWIGGYTDSNTFTGKGEKRNSGTQSVTVTGTSDDDRMRFEGVLANSEVTGEGGNDTLNLGNTVGPAVIRGGSGDDVLVGGLGNDEIDGGSGEDQIDGRGGNDTISGGSENDTIFGGTGNDDIHGDGGDDEIAAGDGADTVYGDDGNDTIMAGADGDMVDAGSGNDLVYGNSGADEISGGTGNDTLWGGSGNDRIQGNSGEDTIYGEGGTDTISGGTEGDWISGGADGDTVHGDEGNDTIYGDGGGDELHGDGGADEIHGGSGNDRIYGGLGGDRVWGDSDEDVIEGNDGADELHGGSGGDRMYGNADDDTIYGDSGVDIIEGNSGNDTIHGGSGEDVIHGNAGADTIYGDEDRDTIYGDEDDDVIHGNDGPDVIEGNAGDDTIYGDEHDDEIYGNDGTDLIHGNGGDDYIEGNAGDDVLYGDADDDEIYGQDGDDIIYGGADDDHLYGADGDDIILGDDGTAALNDYAQTNVVASDGADHMYGEAGADLLLGGGGGDVIVGDNGEDGSASSDPRADFIIGDGGRIEMNSPILSSMTTSASASDGADTIEGNEGDDVILGGGAGDAIYGQAGSDVLLGDQGRIAFADGVPVRIETTAGAENEGGSDTIEGDIGDDIILGGPGGDKLLGNDGQDILLGDEGMVAFDVSAADGGDGSATTLDLIRSDADGLGGSDTILGHAGSDVIVGGSAGDTLVGDNTESTPGAFDMASGAPGADVLIGDNGAVLLAGAGGGSVEVLASAAVRIVTIDTGTTGGADTVFANEGDDIVLGGVNGSSDVLNGNEGDDVILGDNGELDFAYGGDTDLTTLDRVRSYTDGLGGDDVISGNAGADLLIGGSGGDEIHGDDATASAGTDDGDDVILGDNGEVLLSGTTGRRVILGTGVNRIRTTDTSEATGGADTITGDAGSDVILGGVNGSADVLSGSLGDDVILGDNGELDFALGDDTDLATLDLVQSYADGLGGADRISGDAGADTILAGTGGDVVYGASSGSDLGDEADIILGDNGRIELLGVPGKVEILGTSVASIQTTDDTDATGGSDTIHGQLGNDIILGGVNNGGVDRLHGDADDDLILGDNGRVDFGVDGDLSTLDEVATRPYAQHGATPLGGGDVISGDAGDDLAMGGVGDDTIYGDDAAASHGAEDGEDILLGDNGVVLLVGQPGRFVVLGDAVRSVSTTDDESATGGEDMIAGNAASDVVIGGVLADELYGDAVAAADADGADLLLGDNGEMDFGADGDMTTLDRVETLPYASNGTTVLGGPDFMSGNADADTLIGGVAGDTIHGDAATPGVVDGEDVLLGDNGRIDLVGFIGDRFILGSAIRSIVTTDETAETGGADTLGGNADDDVVLGGVMGDGIHGHGGDDILLGDNGRLEWDYEGDASFAAIEEPFTFDTTFETLDLVTTELPDAQPGGRDVIHGDDGRDVIFGGTDADLLYGDNGDQAGAASNDDLMFGDHGRLYPQHSSLVGFPSRNFFAINTGDADGGAGDQVFGEEGDDVMLGQQGDDRMFGGSGSDDMIGGHNVEGGVDELGSAAINAMTTRPVNDLMDGGAGDDALVGDNATIWRNADSLSPRYRVLAEGVLYKMAPNYAQIDPDYGDPDVTDDWQGDPRGTVGRSIELLDHSAAVEATDGTTPRVFGDDLLAGNADDDVLLGHLGDDVIQGDGSIDGAPDGDVGDTTTISVTDSGMPDTGEVLYFNVAESATDGDDYAEGGGGEDRIYGGLGQDDLVGGSSDLFGLTLPDQRPDGSDVLYGGAGVRIDRHYYLDETNAGDIAVLDRHSADADVIAGDNATVYRIVGTWGAYSGAYLTFEYDRTNYFEQRGDLRIIPRAVHLLDYVPGVGDSDVDGAVHGAADVIHGESGDDVIQGMIGTDVLYGESEDDDVYGGAGNDWASGGTGHDAVLGDDGLVLTSRNVEKSNKQDASLSEPLYGVAKVDTVNLYIDTPGDIQQSIIHVEDWLKKAVDLTPFNSGGDDILFGGRGNDALHGGYGDDAVSGSEALAVSGAQVGGELVTFYYEDPLANYDAPAGHVLGFEVYKADEFALYDEYDPLRKIRLDANGELTKDGSGVEFLLNFETDLTDQAGRPIEDHDVLFGDLGNDWLVGGIGQDRLYGGYGSDLINADDNHDTSGGLNDVPDEPVHTGINLTIDPALTRGADTVYGGAGRDVMIGNSGADRLIDWVGEFNSYLVPYAPFGQFSVSRSLQPQLRDYLYALSESDGADPTRAFDTGAEQDRNGEPFGEMGTVLQKDFDWNDQTGAPADPQAGNIPGGKRDVMEAEDFDSGSLAELPFAVDSGVWMIEASRYRGGALPDGDVNSSGYVDDEDLSLVLWNWQSSVESSQGDFNGDGRVDDTDLSVVLANWQQPAAGDAVSLFYVNDLLPNYYEVLATVRTTKPVGGLGSNGYIIFDYQGEDDFGFAGIDVSTNKLQIGRRTPDGWQVATETNVRLKPDAAYNLLVVVNGVTVTLVVEGQTALSYAFEPRVVDGFSYGLNAGMVGVGSVDTVSEFDNVRVQKLPPQFTYERTEDFTDTMGVVSPEASWWQVSDGVLTTQWDGQNTSVAILDVDAEPNWYMELSATIDAEVAAGFVFDYYSASDFKFAAILPESGQVVIGHYTDKGWTYDALAAIPDIAGESPELEVSLAGTTVSVSVYGQELLGYTFNSVLTDGDLGLYSFGGTGIFDNLAVRL